MAATVAAVPPAALAQEAPPAGPRAELDGSATAGALGANLVAGSANQQANVGLIAAGKAGMAIGSLSQSLSIPAIGQSTTAAAGIADGAFSGSAGWLATNVGAGLGNQQANLATIAIGLTGQVATAAMLSQSRASTVKVEALTGPEGEANYQTRIGDTAFEASSGLQKHRRRADRKRRLAASPRSGGPVELPCKAGGQDMPHQRRPRDWSVRQAND